MSNWRFCLAASCMAMGVFAAGSACAGPSISRGEQFIGGNEAGCMAQARNAFASGGWNNIGSGGSYVVAVKGAYSAYITCNASARGGVVVNIFVASSLVPDGIPGDPNPGDTNAGAQRVALQSQIR